MTDRVNDMDMFTLRYDNGLTWDRVHGSMCLPAYLEFHSSFFLPPSFKLFLLFILRFVSLYFFWLLLLPYLRGSWSLQPGFHRVGQPSCHAYLQLYYMDTPPPRFLILIFISFSFLWLGM